MRIQNMLKKCILFTLMFFLFNMLLSLPPHAAKGSLKPVGGKKMYTVNMDMKDLHKDKTVTGGWEKSGISGALQLPVEVEGGCSILPTNNYFTSVIEVNAPSGNTSLLDDAVKIEIQAFIQSKGTLNRIPWLGESDSRLNCLSKKIQTAGTGSVTVTLDPNKEFDLNKLPNSIVVKFFGKQSSAPTDFSEPYVLREVNIIFTNWLPPYECNLKVTPDVIDFSEISESDLIKGVGSKALAVDTECQGGLFTPAKESGNNMTKKNLDSIATTIRFKNDKTSPRDSDFKTINPTTNEVNDNLVFRINDRETNRLVENDVPIDISLTKNTVNNPISSSKKQFDVYPYWKGGTNRDIPLGHFETSGVVIFELE